MLASLGNTGFYKFLTSVMGIEYFTYSSTSDESPYYWTGLGDGAAWRRQNRQAGEQSPAT